MASTLREQLAGLAARRDWRQVRDIALRADENGALDAEELESLADASWWLGRVTECIAVRNRAFEIYDGRGDRVSAARVTLLLSEDRRRQGRGVVGEALRRRAARLLEGVPERIEHGYLRLYRAERARRTGQLADARQLLHEAAAIADRLGDADLAADVTQELGRVMILDGEPAEGLALMDEAMLAASEGRLGAYTTGKVYCATISACEELGEIEHVAEWRRVAAAWSDEHGVAVFPGMCRVHHAELLAHVGLWDEAEQAAERAGEELREVGWVVAFAYATIGQIRRLRGDYEGAAAAFARAEDYGLASDGGRALLQLAVGDVEGAGRCIRAALDAAPHQLARARLLPASVEIAVAAGDIATADSAAAELEQVAEAYGTLKLRASAALARARVCVAEGHWAAAVRAATTSIRQWQDLEGPYEVACARVVHARACRELGDHDACRASLDIAAATFRELGAAADLAAVDCLRGVAPASPRVISTLPGGVLTPREVEVLQLLATGATNKMIAAELVLSQKTVARHVSNIFTKLGVSTRAAAAAYAVQHHLTAAPS